LSAISYYEVLVANSKLFYNQIILAPLRFNIVRYIK